MNRFVSICLALAAAPLVCAASEPFPVVHHEPLTVRVLDGASGQPRAGLRVVLAGGYTERDIALGLWQEGIMTNASGEVRIPDALANLPFLRVWVVKTKSCQIKGAPGRLVVDRIRNEGVRSENSCGAATVAATPGTLVLFVRTGSGPVGGTATASAAPAPPAPPQAAARAPEPDQPIDPGTAAAFAAYERLLPPQF